MDKKSTWALSAMNSPAMLIQAHKEGDVGIADWRTILRIFVIADRFVLSTRSASAGAKSLRSEVSNSIMRGSMGIFGGRTQYATSKFASTICHSSPKR